MSVNVKNSGFREKTMLNLPEVSMLDASPNATCGGNVSKNYARDRVMRFRTRKVKTADF